MKLMKYWETIKRKEFMIKQECQVTNNNKQVKEIHSEASADLEEDSVDLEVLKDSKINSDKHKEVVKAKHHLSEIFLKNSRSSLEAEANSKVVAREKVKQVRKVKTL